MKLAVHRWGDGPRVVLVHGVIASGTTAWTEQRPLTERWSLEAVDRPGHGDSPPGPRDFVTEGELVAEQLLDAPAHLVGHSYGAIVCAFAAAIRPEHVRSLVLVEPPAFHHGRGNAVVEEAAQQIRRLTGGELEDPREILEAFLGPAGVPVPLPLPAEIPGFMVDGARQLVGTRPPDEAEMPLDQLANAPFDVVVVTGGHSDRYEVPADAIAVGCGARREIVRGAGHLVPATGAPFNELLEAVWRSAAAAHP